MEQLALIINPLALKEHHRVCSDQCAVHQALGVIRRSRHHDLEAGDMRDQRRRILRMLCAVFGADRRSEHDRHAQRAAAHSLPLCHLVEDLISGTAEEIGEHQLNNRPAASHRVSHSGADDRAL